MAHKLYVRSYNVMVKNVEPHFDQNNVFRDDTFSHFSTCTFSEAGDKSHRRSN